MTPKPKKPGKPRPLESSIESYFTKKCRKLGIFVAKNTGLNGIPDRVLIKDGLVIFLELKRPGEKPSDLQKAVMKKMRRRGAIVRWADTKPKIDRLLEIFNDPEDPDNPKTKRKRRLLGIITASKLERACGKERKGNDDGKDR